MKHILFIFSILILSACSTSGTSILLGEGKSYSPTSIDSIQFLDGAPDAPHEVFAMVEGTAATDDYFTKKRTKEAAVLALKEEAARIGADAVIILDTDSEEYGGVWDKIHIKGKALVYIQE
jgi:hypothetical protein